MPNRAFLAQVKSDMGVNLINTIVLLVIAIKQKLLN